MRKYIFIRPYNLKRENGSTHAVISKGAILSETKDAFVTTIGDFTAYPVAQEMTPELQAHLLALDENLFYSAFASHAYMSWIKEFARDVDDRGLSMYPGLSRNPETLIMYLKDVGLSSAQILKGMYGPDNTYAAYKKMADEFGQTPIE